ncbi:MAG: alpha/beta fold hydrolase [Hyphomicrobiaceae bacterium]|nr:alpha/beta fold hydrolase [Hyphomicrobiaceae bacterium]MCC0024962.1 alpha/beta fold hydrolase [Hyphomicrobiaceae bacterium]
MQTMQESEYAIESHGGPIAGSLTAPMGGTCPLVICAHGTGQHDRNEGVLHVFDAIAGELAGHGVATYRFDKRGAGKTRGDYDALAYSDFYRDFEAIFDHFDRNRSDRFSHIIALGHSEGTMMAAELATKRPVDGVVLLAPFIENMEKILMDQAKRGEEAVVRMRGIGGMLTRLAVRLFGKPSDQQRKLIDRLKSTEGDTFRYRFQTFQARHMRELLALDPEAIYRQVEVPALIIGGAKDAQCNPDDVGKIAGILGARAEAHLLPDLSHLLRNDVGTGSFETYRDQLKRPVEHDVLRLISGWIAQFGT